jgi:hypothetical protein
MITKTITKKLKEYGPTNAIEQENALAEIVQLYVLASLARSGFFRVAEFHGGTFLRIVHGLDRFSEGLDFALLQPDPAFAWKGHLDRIVHDCAAEGLSLDAVDKPDRTVGKALLKTDSFGALLQFDRAFARHRRKKLVVKLEVDVNPPSGSTHETSFLSFPTLSAITTQTLPSAFSGKLHALLCRSYVKGRDWYDFLWYSARGVGPNMPLLANAIAQAGPWVHANVTVDDTFLISSLREKVASIDWKQAAEDVRRFLRPREQESLPLWGEALFSFHVSKLEQTLRGSATQEK